MNQSKVYLNGEYLPLNEAKISVLDRGFLFGDGVYEVMPVYKGHFFSFKAHIERLNHSLKRVSIDLLRTEKEWLTLLEPLIDKTRHQYIYLHLTRGVAPKRDHAFPVEVTPTVFAMCSDIVPFTKVASGVKAISLDDSRWELCDVKATTLLANVLLRQQAIDKGCAEAILIKDDYVTEGAASNLFAVIDGVLVTPPKNSEILAGITRQVILEIAKLNNIPVAEEKITFSALKTASEIWLTSSTREIVPVIELDGEIVADGNAGAVWKKMQQLFQDYKYTG